MTEVIIAKFGGSTIGQNGDQIPTVIERIKAMRKKGKKIVAVFENKIDPSILFQVLTS